MCENNGNKNCAGDPVFSQEFLEGIYSEKTPLDFPNDDNAGEFYGEIEGFLKSGKFLKEIKEYYKNLSKGKNKRRF